MILFSFFIAINIILYYFFNNISNWLNLFDEPDETRKIHVVPISKIGGFLFLINFILFFLITSLFIVEPNRSFLYSLSDYLSLFLGGILFFYIGYYDDKFKLSATRRLIIFSIILLGLVLIDQDLNITRLNFSFLEYHMPTAGFSIYLTVLCILLFVNAFNMFDGINLQAGLYMLFIFSIVLYKGFLISLPIILIFCSLLFLYLNFREKVFLGNNGSIFISFLICYIFIKAHNSNFFYADEIFLIMLIPGVDMLRMCFLRLMRGESPFKADNEHIHHLILKRKSILFTNILIQSLVILPYAVYLVLDNSLVTILISLFFYSIIIYCYNKKNL